MVCCGAGRIPCDRLGALLGKRVTLRYVGRSSGTMRYLGLCTMTVYRAGLSAPLFEADAADAVNLIRRGTFALEEAEQGVREQIAQFVEGLAL